MILGAIAVILLCAIVPPAIGAGQTGILIGVIVVALALFGMAHENRKDVKAWHNRREYWAKGGPEQYMDRK